MAVTPNYSWPVPVNTDLVKDGAEAIKALGDAIDATVFGLPSGALALVKTQVIGSAVTNVQVNDCFNSTYSNYRIIVSILANSATDTNIGFQFVDGTTPVTSTNYEYAALGLSSSNVTENKSASGATSFVLGSTSSAQMAFGLSLDVYKPQLANQTTITYTASNTYNTGRFYSGSGTGRLALTTQLEGIAILSSSGTITGGTIAVYGYQN